MDDLDALFQSVDGFKEDLIDFGIAGVSAVGANIAFGYIEGFVYSKLPMNVPVAVRGLLAIAAGVASGAFLAKYNRNVATGVAVGLAANGVSRILKEYVPQLGLSGLSDDEYRLLGPGIAGAPTMVEQVDGLGYATSTIEQVSGLAALS